MAGYQIGKKFTLTIYLRGFPDDSGIKSLPVNEEDVDLIPGPGISHMLWSS